MEEISDNSNYVRIKLNHTEGNKAKGFYLLLTNGNTYSDKKDEFVVERKFLSLLDQHRIKHKVLPLNEE
tara:strand:+ start:292 stop:498 length:207 start_codon:yes stop_codon:yes gene_type:complete